MCLVFAIAFNKIFDFTCSMFSKIGNEYVRVFVGSLIVIFPIYFLGTLFYGNNPDLIKGVISSNSMWYSFIAKAILTSVCLSIGFRGGKIAPSFCVVTNFYVSSVVLGVEVFGIICSPIYILVVLILYCLRKGNYLSSRSQGGVK